MRTVRIKVYQFDELGPKARLKAIEEHRAFLEMLEQHDFPASEVIESIIENGYEFTKDGELYND